MRRTCGPSRPETVRQKAYWGLDNPFHTRPICRDSRRLAGLHRAGELTPITVPGPAQEAVRDLCRTRGDMVEDLRLC